MRVWTFNTETCTFERGGRAALAEADVAVISDHTDVQNTNAVMVTCHIPFFSWSAV